MSTTEQPQSKNEAAEECGPFKATQLWKKLISCLKTNVRVKRKRIAVGQSESVFSGQSAVDVVYTCLIAERREGASSLITKHVTRNVASKVCQSLLDSHVFIPLATSKNLSVTPKNRAFSDDDTTFYYFTTGDDFTFPSPSPFKVENNSNRLRLGILSSPSIFSSFKSGSNRKDLPITSKKASLVHCRRLLSSERLENSSDISDLELARKEIAFRHLLSLIDLAFLEDLVPTYELIQPNSAVEKLLNDLTSSTAEFWMEIVKELTDSSCAYYDNPVGLSNEQLKRQEYLKLRHHYRDHPIVIVPTRYNDIFIAILGLMKMKEFSKALQATQFALLLLPYNQRKTLHLCLKFMDFVAQESIQLENDIENEQLVLDHFTSTIFDIKLMAAAETLVLTHFLLLNQKSIFNVPNVIKQELLEDYRHESTFIGQDSLFCEQIPESIYKDQTHTESKVALEQLMESIMDSTTIPLKEKQKYLKRFKKQHPEIYDKFIK